MSKTTLPKTVSSSMGIYDDLATISLRFSNEKIERIAGDTIAINTILDTTKDKIHSDALDNIRHEIITIINQAFTRTVTSSRIDVIVNNHMPLCIKNVNGSR
jgi:hypothetical protein